MLSAKARATRGLTAAALSLLCFGCAIADPEPSATSFPLAGLHTPESRIGASDPTDVESPGASLGDRCPSDAPPDNGASADDDAGTMGPAATLGVLDVSYTTHSVDGLYAPKNATAVWIEDASGEYVATIELLAILRRPDLLFFQERGCEQVLGPDVMTGATLREHSLHELQWNAVDTNEQPVPDGRYSLWIEVTETDVEPGLVESFEFDKGPMPYSMVLPVSFEGALSEAAITWTPEGSGN